MAPEGSSSSVFLSYAHEDRPTAEALSHALEQQGVSVWTDAGLRPGERWEDSIRKALLAADNVVVLLTPASVESRWVRLEWSEALAKSRLVIPVVAGGLKPSELPAPLAHFQAVRFDPTDTTGVVHLAAALRQPDQQVPKPGDVIDVDRVVAIVTEQVLARLERGPALEPTACDFIFVVISFSDDMDPTFDAIEAAARTAGIEARRVKDVPGDYRITDQILEMIRASRFVVADLTHERPNVYFELGYARGIGKTVVTIKRHGSPAHFDVQDWTYLEYRDSRPLERDLTKRFEYELGRG